VVAAHAVVTGQVTYDGALPARALEVQVRNVGSAASAKLWEL
jgi:hypothetical protein